MVGRNHRPRRGGTIEEERTKFILLMKRGEEYHQSSLGTKLRRDEIFLSHTLLRFGLYSRRRPRERYKANGLGGLKMESS